MSWEHVAGNWTELKGKIRERCGELTDDELVRIGGQREQFVVVLQCKYGTAREEAEEQADAWAESVRLHPHT